MKADTDTDFKSAPTAAEQDDEAYSDVLDQIVAERALDLPRGTGQPATDSVQEGIRPAVSLDDNAAVRDLMDGIP